MDKLTIR